MGTWRGMLNSMTRMLGATLATALVALAPGQSVRAQDAGLPKVIKIVVPFSTGGSNDVYARALGQKLASRLGVTFIVENKPGAGGAIGADIVARADPDGSTLLLTSTSFATNAATKANLPFDPIRSFSPVAIVAKGPMALIVGDKTPYRTVADLVAATRDAKNTVNYSSAGVGSIGQLSVELFKSMSGTTALHVPYQGVNVAVTDMIGGHIDYMITTTASVGGPLKAGQIRPIAVTSLEPSRFYPGVPAVAATIPGYYVDVWWVVLAPSRTPSAVINTLNAAIREVSQQPEMVSLFAQEGAEPTDNSPEQAADYVTREVNRWKKVAQDGNIREN